jgi:poly-gamma-glutamate capsule biosynthesis protein CapA/YwtB (metallophosphatase superfamily)
VAITLGLAGDTMLGRKVAERLAETAPEDLVSAEVVDVAREADLFVLNLECCVSDRGERWPSAVKPFFFRAPPAAVRTLVHLGVDCVTLANNHALDYGAVALLDTLEHLSRSGISLVGAGADVGAARSPAVLVANGLRLAVIGVTDHPSEFAATADRPGVAFADLRRGVPEWLIDAIEGARADADAVLVTPHWGPNMSPEPVRHVRSAAEALVAAGATLVAGHSAHVFQGVRDRVLFDLGDFLDDYAVDPVMRNDLGLLFLVTLDERGPVRLEAVPLALDYCSTRLATGDETDWVCKRFRLACRRFGTEVIEEDGRLVTTFASGP